MAPQHPVVKPSPRADRAHLNKTLIKTKQHKQPGNNNGSSSNQTSNVPRSPHWFTMLFRAPTLHASGAQCALACMQPWSLMERLIGLLYPIKCITTEHNHRHHSNTPFLSQPSGRAKHRMVGSLNPCPFVLFLLINVTVLQCSAWSQTIPGAIDNLAPSTTGKTIWARLITAS